MIIISWINQQRVKHFLKPGRISQDAMRELDSTIKYILELSYHNSKNKKSWIIKCRNIHQAIIQLSDELKHQEICYNKKDKQYINRLKGGGSDNSV